MTSTLPTGTTNGAGKADSRYGRVVQVIGPVLDVEFHAKDSLHDEAFHRGTRSYSIATGWTAKPS